MFKKLKMWWDSIKPVVLSGVFVKLDNLKIPLADKIKEIEGTPQEQADKIIEWIKEYLKRQL